MVSVSYTHLVFRLHQQPGHMEPIPLSEAKVLPLVTPSKVVCVGLNYKAHAEAVSYTHLDVYKRQESPTAGVGARDRSATPKGRSRRWATSLPMISPTRVTL